MTNILSFIILRVMKNIRVAVCQINTVIGDLSGNVQKILKGIANATEFKADIVTFPELAIPGYPPEDLLLKPRFIEDNLSALKKIVKATGKFVTIVGFIDNRDDIYNSAAIIYDRKIYGIYHKC